MADELNDLELTWGFDLGAFLEERAQKVPAAGDAGTGTAETIGSSQERAVEACSAPAGGFRTAEAMRSSQGGPMDAPSAPAGRAESGPGEAPASDTEQRERRLSLCDPVGGSNTRAQQLGTAPSDSMEPNPWSELMPGV